MNPNERYILSLEGQLEKAKEKIKELEQSQQAITSGSLPLQDVKELLLKVARRFDTVFWQNALMKDLPVEEIIKRYNGKDN